PQRREAHRPRSFLPDILPCIETDIYLSVSESETAPDQAARQESLLPASPAAAVSSARRRSARSKRRAARYPRERSSQAPAFDMADSRVPAGPAVRAGRSPDNHAS